MFCLFANEVYHGLMNLTICETLGNWFQNYKLLVINAICKTLSRPCYICTERNVISSTSFTKGPRRGILTSYRLHWQWDTCHWLACYLQSPWVGHVPLADLLPIVPESGTRDTGWPVTYSPREWYTWHWLTCDMQSPTVGHVTLTDLLHSVPDSGTRDTDWPVTCSPRQWDTWHWLTFYLRSSTVEHVTLADLSPTVPDSGTRDTDR
jgi:hypothetical protein